MINILKSAVHVGQIASRKVKNGYIGWGCARIFISLQSIMSEPGIIPEDLIARYYAHQPELHRMLLLHSKSVAARALRIAENHPEWNIDRRFVYEAAMLHDVGILYTDAAGIHCNGCHPYLLHGLLGGNILRHEGLCRHARVAERHTGTGLKAQTIIERGLPLPVMDWIPVTLEEKIVCYADKFYSKSRIGEEKTHEQVVRSLSKFGSSEVEIFKQWAELFE